MLTMKELRPKIEFVEQLEDFACETNNQEKALKLAMRAHEGQKRSTGGEYITHCVAVASLLRSWGVRDEAMICAALLHDAVEDTDWVSVSMIEGLFEDKKLGKEVGFLVDGVSKFRSETGEGSDFLTLKKVLLRTNVDPRVAILKLADRYHNTLTLEVMPEEKRVKKARETLEVYTELAKSLGLWVVASDLEDRSFMLIDSAKYWKVRKQIDADVRLNVSFIEGWKSFWDWWMKEQGLKGDVEIRVKGYYNAQRKRDRLSRKGRSNTGDFREINDLVSFRLIMDSLEDADMCWGRQRREFSDKIDFERSDDFISTPAPNGYSAYQETFLTDHGLIEVAITTREKEEFNNWGVISLLGQGVELQEYVLKPVFVENGGVLFLPSQATGVDMAYAISPRLGAEAIFLVVDGERMPLTTILPPAAIVGFELGDPRRAPEKGLISFSLPNTRKMIQEQLAQEDRMVVTEKGRKQLGEVLMVRGLLDLADIPKKLRNPVLYDVGCQSLEELHFLIGGGYLDLEQLGEIMDKRKITKEELGLTTVLVGGQDRKGVLEMLGRAITDSGGNVVNVKTKLEEDQYELKLIVEDLGDEEMLRKKIDELGIGSDWLVV